MAVALVVGIVHCGGRSSSDPEVGAVAEAGTDGGHVGDRGEAGDGGDGGMGEACPATFAPAGSACTTEGKSCNYCHMESGSGSMLGTFCADEICKGGAWELVPRTCSCLASPPTGQPCYGDTIGCRCGYDGCGASRRTFTCKLGGSPPAMWIEDMPAVACSDAGM